MLKIKFKGDPVLRLMKVLNKWAERGIFRGMKKTSTKLAKRYRDMIKAGNEPDKRSSPLQDSTMISPIRVGDKGSPIRGEVNPSRTPLVATGQTVNSIKSKTKNNLRSIVFEIGSDDARANRILGANARGKANWKHSGSVKRDPLRVTDREVEFIADEIVKDLDRTLKKGF